jgi:NAD+ synthase
MNTNIKNVKNKIISELRSFTDVAVIGLSGGADSLLVALLCTEALGKENLRTFGMPYGELDRETFNSLSRRYAEFLGIPYQDVSVFEQTQSIVKSLTVALGIPESKLSTLNCSNARVRSRANILYGVAHHLNETLGKRVRVIGTGNLSEDFIGYDTKGGDALADMFPIGQLFKSEVYKILDQYRDDGVIEEWMINRVPSAGLWVGQTDEGELGHSYADMEVAIRYLWKHYSTASTLKLNDTQRFVWKRHLANKHKHEAPPVVVLRKASGDIDDDAPV